SKKEARSLLLSRSIKIFPNSQDINDSLHLTTLVALFRKYILAALPDGPTWKPCHLTSLVRIHSIVHEAASEVIILENFWLKSPQVLSFLTTSCSTLH
ncbi:MAG: hypothetical protein Q8874_02525, partial [Sweet potato little leaf phytoplasma]|nr:hypothetical protein [Sweet potato little leaf phytoplasma]